MFYDLFVNKNQNVKYEYERYVQENLEEHYTNRLKQWKILLNLNWHYRVKKSKQPLLYWDTYQSKKQELVCNSNKEKQNCNFDSNHIVNDVHNGSLKPASDIYKKMMEDYASKDFKMLLCPYAGTGDVYLVCLFINQFVKKNNIDHYVLAIIGQANYKVAKLFEIENIVKISQEEADKLTYLYMAICDECNDIILMHHDPIQNYCGILENLRNINNTNFMDMYLNNVFNGLTIEDKVLPNFKYESKKIRDLIFRNRIEEGNTVVLSPYVNTLPAIPWWVWRELAEKLKMQGYMVCTNCGSPTEKAIEGTVALRFDYDVSVPILEKCGYFVGIRSGFCDIISSAKCKKIIIYQPYIFWGEGDNLDYFSLNINGFCDDAVEIEYEGIEFTKLIDDIVQNIKNKEH